MTGPSEKTEGLSSNPNEKSTPIPPFPRTLTGEIIAASGPRKESRQSIQQIELGEDCGGLCFLDNEAQFIWIADGTSNMSRKGPFSSRILAQDLGRIVTQFAIIRKDDLLRESNEETTFAKLLNETVLKVHAEWNDSLKTDAIAYRSLFEELKMLNQKGPGNIFFEFSSTLALGYLNYQGKFRAAGVGDSYLIINGKRDTRFYSLAKGSITFHLQLKEDKIKFEVFIPKIQSFQFDEIDFCLLSTDGTKETVKHLYEVLSSPFECTLKNIFDLKKTLARISSKTQDDKMMGWIGRFYES